MLVIPIGMLVSRYEGLTKGREITPKRLDSNTI